MEKKLFRMPNHEAARALLLKIAKEVLDHGDFPSNYTADELIVMKEPEIFLSSEDQDMLDQINRLVEVLLEHKKI
jgi:hypothetical protein